MTGVGRNTNREFTGCDNCDDGSRPEEQHIVVSCFDEEIVKFPTQPTTTEISGDNAGLRIVSSRFSDIVAWLVPLSLKNSIESIVSRLVFAAASYYIWQERNNHLFSNDSRQEEHVCDAIMKTVRFKMTSIHFK
ncbi:hypothetical protein Tco_0597652 [Tanacetum coccineum]